MKNVLKYTAVLTVVCCFGLSIFAQKNENSNGNRKNSNISVKIETLGNTQFISENEIINFLKNNKLYSEKMSVEKISTDRIITSLEKSFAVKNVSCYAAKSGVLVIKAEQRKPLFRVMGGSNFYIDVERKIFEIHKIFPANLPIVTGVIDTVFAKKDLFDFVKFMEDNDFKNLIEQIVVRENNFIELVPRVGNQKIIVGNLRDKQSGNLNFKAKLNRLKKFYEKYDVLSYDFDGKSGWEKYSTIDLRFKGQIVCTRK